MRLRVFATREGLLVGIGIAVLGTAAFHVPAAASSGASLRPLTTAGYSDNVSGGFVLGADNTNGSNPFNDYGVEGKVDNDVGGVGVLGYGQQAKSYGVYGVTFGLNGIGVYGAGIAATPAPATTPNSSNVTTGVVGDSHSGDGVFGTTEWPGTANPFVNPIAGVVGIDTRTTGGGQNDGVFGMTTKGGFGVAGAATSGSMAAVGASGTGTIGVYAFSDTSYALFASSNTGQAVNASSATNIAVRGVSEIKDGISGYSTGGVDKYPAAGGEFEGAFASLIGIAGNVQSDPPSQSYPLIAVDKNFTTIFSVDNTGGTHVYGTLYLHAGQATFGRTRTNGVHVREYSPTASRPTTEDFGEAEIINGSAYVRLDPSFAQSIDDRSPYLVFVTPNGDTKGLYVVNRTMAGFAVHEVQGGRSSLPFSYRIVATQYGETGKRQDTVRQSELASMDPARFGVHRLNGQMPHGPAGFKRAQDGTVPRAFYLPRPNFAVEHRPERFVRSR